MAFNKKRGDEVDHQKIKKRVYLIEDQGLYSKLMTILDG
ncbi:MAG: hypothetical protein ACJ8MO_16035 [Bacillus sp. (in: firmicutes)]